MPQRAAKLRSRRDLFRALLGESPAGGGESKGEEAKRAEAASDAKDAPAAAPAPRRKGVRPGAIPAVRSDDDE